MISDYQTWMEFTFTELRVLTFTTLWANSADNKLMTNFLFLTEKKDLTFHTNYLCWRQLVWNVKTWKSKKNISIYRLLQILPRVLSVNKMSPYVRKSTFWHMLQTKTQISLRIRAVWLESSFFAWVNFASLAIQNAHRENSNQNARMLRLIWIFSGSTCLTVRYYVSVQIVLKINARKISMDISHWGTLLKKKTALTWSNSVPSTVAPRFLKGFKY